MKSAKMMENDMPCIDNARIRFLLLMVAALFALPAGNADATTPVPRTVLIIDGSGSMWGRINSREKIVIARRLLAENIALLKGKTDLGVMSYGHRRRRDCRDIEMIVPIGKIDPKTYGETIKRLLPRGKTPVASALKMAAEALSSGPPNAPGDAPYHIILVADGNENCRQDPCKTAANLVLEHPGLKIDVIGFGVPDAEVEQLQCIARKGHGRFYRAENSDRLKVAITDIFSGLVPLAAHPARPQKPKVTTPPGLYLSAGLSDDDPPLKDNLAWRIYRHGESSKSGAQPLKRQTGGNIFWSLPEGQYHVEVRYRNLLAERDVKLRAGTAVKQRLSFNIGVLAARARLETASPPMKQVIFSLYDASSGSFGPGNIIAHKQEEKAVFYLPPGKYRLRAQAGEASARHDFSLQAGDRIKTTLLLDAGQISLKARLARGGPELDDVQYAIYRRGDKQDMEFVRTLDPAPQLILPAGNYLVLARKGAASRYERLKINAGDKKQLVLDLDAGILKLSSSLEQGNGKQQTRIAWTITPAGSTRPKTVKLSLDNRLEEVDQHLPTRSFRNSFILPAGRYKVEAHYGNSNAGAIAGVEVKAGEQTARKLTINAGHIRLSLALSDKDEALPGVFWSVLDTNGKQVASASSKSPLLTLSSGSYEAVADYLGSSYRRRFIINNGDNKKVQLIVQ